MSTSDRLAYDRASVRRYDHDGRLHVEMANISKSNICPYFGNEIPNSEALSLDPKRIYQLFRDPEELKKGADTSNIIQLMQVHDPVTPDQPKQMKVVGSTGTDAVFEAPFLKNSLAVWVQSAIDLIESNKKKQLSCGYHYRADMVPGTYEGVHYDGVMRDIKFNHVALVEEGRAGDDVVIGDEMPLLLTRIADENFTLALDAFEEGKHPRSENGQFGSGGGSSSSVGAEPHGLVTHLVSEHGTPEKIGQHLKSVPTDKLEKAFDLIKGSNDHQSNTVRALISKEVHERAKKSAGAGPANTGFAKEHPLVTAFLTENATPAAREKHLKSVPTEKLQTALRLIKASGSQSMLSNTVHSLLSKELKSRDVSVNDAMPTELRTGTIPMKTSRKALLVRGAIATYLRPKLAQDAKIDLKAVLLGTTAINYPTAKLEIANRLKTAAAGKLAKDASLEDVHGLLDSLDREGEDDDLDDAMDSEESEEDKKKRLEKEAADKAACDEEAETEEEKKERMEKRAKDKAAKDRAAKDKAKDESPEEKEKRERAEKEAADKAARDAEPKPVTKEAMDAAINAAVRDTQAKQQQIREAERIVRPWIGELTMAQDSAEAVYRLALDSLPNKPNLTGVHPSAFRALLEAHPKPSAALPTKVAMDAAQAKTFAAENPDVVRIRVLS